MTSKVSGKNVKYTKPFLSMRKKLKCLKCMNSLHIQCSIVDNRQYLSYKNGKKDFICQYCTDYSCLKCDKHVYDRQPGFLCNICNAWVHRSCAGISKKEYEELQDSDNEEQWYCRPRKINLFPLVELTNNQLIKLHENNKTKNQNKDYNTFSNSQKISIVCSIVQKGVSAPFLFSFPLSVETCNPNPYPTPLDTTHHRKIPDSMMIH